MKTAQLYWQNGEWISHQQYHLILEDKHCLILVFGYTAEAKEALSKLQQMFKHSYIIGCSTAGEITRNEVLEHSLLATVMLFEHSHFHCASASLVQLENDSYKTGELLAKQLTNISHSQQQLKHIFVLSDGLNVNGAELVKGISSQVQNSVGITGGLAGDYQDFSQTFVLWQQQFTSNIVVAVGFYGDRFHVGYGSRGGWTAFGMERRVTRSNNNVLFELDDQNALEVYKSYLGDLSNELPASGLRFPLELSMPNNTKLVRTLLAVDEKQGSITFAGDITENATVRLMRANVDSLIDGAEEAGHISATPPEGSLAVAILVSCVGRKILLNQLSEEEVLAVAKSLTEQTMICGFYSYGEIAPLEINCNAELHNQTMTITTLWES